MERFALILPNLGHFSSNWRKLDIAKNVEKKVILKNETLKNNEHKFLDKRKIYLSYI